MLLQAEMMHSIRDMLAETSEFRLRIFGVYVVPNGTNLLAWIWALLTFYDRPVLLGTALLALGLGIRHAVNADHVAAIDNIVCK